MTKHSPQEIDLQTFVTIQANGKPYLLIGNSRFRKDKRGLKRYGQPVHVVYTESTINLERAVTLCGEPVKVGDEGHTIVKLNALNSHLCDCLNCDRLLPFVGSGITSKDAEIPPPTNRGVFSDSKETTSDRK